MILMGFQRIWRFGCSSGLAVKGISENVYDSIDWVVWFVNELGECWCFNGLRVSGCFSRLVSYVYISGLGI